MGDGSSDATFWDHIHFRQNFGFIIHSLLEKFLLDFMLELPHPK